MSTSIQVAYPYDIASLTQLMDGLRGCPFDTPAHYKIGVQSIAACRVARVAIEERRKLLKQDSLEYGRKVDAVAKQLVDIIEAVEKPLKAAKLEVDNEKERLKREAAEAERRAVEERIRAEREAEELALRVKRQAEEAELVEQRRALEAERKAAAAERAQLQAERDAAAKEFVEIRERKAAEAREQAAKERAERMAAEAEEQRINALEYEQARQKRLAALQPDQDKLTQMARALRAFATEHSTWEFESESACQAADAAIKAVLDAAAELETWKEAQR